MDDQKIQDFYRVATARKFSRDYQLRINYFSVPGVGELFGPDDLVYLKTATLPSRKIEVVKAPFMGVNFNVPGLATYTGSDSWSITFYCDENIQIRQRLELAQNTVFSSFNSIGNLGVPDETSQIELVVLNDKFEPVTQYMLIGAFVSDIGAIDYKTTGTGTIQEVKATIAYQFWRGTIDEPFIVRSEGGIFGVLDSITKGANTIAQTAGAVAGISSAISQTGRALTNIRR